MIDPKKGGVITSTQNVCFRGSHKPFNISEQILAGLAVKTTDSLSQLEKYQIPDGVIERLRQKEPFKKMTEIQIKEIVDEFKKFVAIVAINYARGKKIEMVGELIDELWHTFILFTNDYRKFCDTTVGEYIHHDPNVNAEDRNGPLFISKKKRNIEFFYEEYENFGPSPAIWKQKLPQKNSEQKAVAWYIIVSTAILVASILIWQSITSPLFAQLEAFLFGCTLIFITHIVYKKTRDKIIKDTILHGTLIIGIILLAFSIIFAYICQFGIFAHFLVLLYVGTGLTIANSSSKSGKTTRSGGGPLYSIGEQ